MNISANRENISRIFVLQIGVHLTTLTYKYTWVCMYMCGVSWFRDFPLESRLTSPSLEITIKQGSASRTKTEVERCKTSTLCFRFLVTFSLSFKLSSLPWLTVACDLLIYGGSTSFCRIANIASYRNAGERKENDSHLVCLVYMRCELV